MSDLEIGKVVKQYCGFGAELVEILQDGILKVRFPNGSEKFCKKKAFLKGELFLDVKGKMCTHEVLQQNSGELIEIIELLPNNSCLVEFTGGVQKMYSRDTILQGRATNSINYKKYMEGREIYQVIPNVGKLKAELVGLVGSCMCRLKFDDDSENICLRAEFTNKDALPLWLERREDGVYYKKTGELLVSIEWDEFQSSYVGVLRRSDGSEYTSLLGKE